MRFQVRGLTCCAARSRSRRPVCHNSQPRNVVCVIKFRINVLTSHPLCSILWSSRFTRPGLIYISGEKRSIKIKIKVSPGAPGVYTYPSLPMLHCLPASWPVLLFLPLITSRHITSIITSPPYGFCFSSFSREEREENLFGDPPRTP